MAKALQRFRARDVDALLDWYKKNQRDFPWRSDPTPYWVWLAEIMSQQTQMATLVPYFHRFIAKFPDVAALAQAEEQDVLAAWAGLGYYSRARNVHRAAQMVVRDRGGEFPETVEEWLKLPGVGPYTAAAVASQCFGVREPVWDGNVVRVCARLDARADALTAPFKIEMLSSLREKMKERDASSFNQAMMELGATVCTPKAASCGRCPLQQLCDAHRLDAVDKFPPPKARKKTVELRCRVHVRLRKTKGCFEAFLEQRTESHWFPRLWDFPSELGGAASPWQNFRQSLGAAEYFGEVRHQITNHRIFLLGNVELVLRANDSDNNSRHGRWVALDDLAEDDPPLPLSTTARKILKLLFQKYHMLELAHV
ncbi:MAG: A/G-specific adenine glycosylase [Deltaproteobacteria bacterium]|nr:A/G-specific adenine glycosylase [Deltaproteobacteria bacterium]